MSLSAWCAPRSCWQVHEAERAPSWLPVRQLALGRVVRAEAQALCNPCLFPDALAARPWAGSAAARAAPCAWAVRMGAAQLLDSCKGVLADGNEGLFRPLGWGR